MLLAGIRPIADCRLPGRHTARQGGTARGKSFASAFSNRYFPYSGPEAAIHAVTGKIKLGVGSASNTASPPNVYRCADGKYLALLGSTPAVAKRFFEIIGRPEMIDDPRFATNSDRVKNRPLVDAAIGEWFATRNSAEALETMRQAGATVEPVYNIADAISDTDFAEREIIVDVEHDGLGTLPMHDIVLRLSATSSVWRRPAPGLGEHNDELLREVGVDPATVGNAGA